MLISDWHFTYFKFIAFLMEDDLTLLLNKKDPQSTNWKISLPVVKNSKKKNTVLVSLVEKVLISNLKAGDSQAFSNIFNAYYNDLVIFARKFTKDFDSAEEIVQDTFVRFWEERLSIQVNTSLKSYLLKMVQNKCIDLSRHKKIMHLHLKFVIANSPISTYDTDNYILHSELEEQIEAALNSLPAEISAAFRMSRYKGLKYNEIADIFGVSSRTIEVRMSKALQLLHSRLIEYFVTITCMFYLISANT